MIEEMTYGKLTEYEFSPIDIEALLSAPALSIQERRDEIKGAESITSTDSYYALKSQSKIYSGDDYLILMGIYREFPYTDAKMVKSYYAFNLQVYLSEQRYVTGSLFVASVAKKRFKVSEINKAELAIFNFQALNMTKEYSKQIDIQVMFIAWLGTWVGEQPTKIIGKSYNLRSTLTEQQIRKIFELVEELKLFNDSFSHEDLVSIFDCTANKTFEVNSNQTFTLLFNNLQPRYITQFWQNAIAKSKCFVGRRGSILNATNLSASLSNSNYNGVVAKKIKRIISSL